MKSQNYKGDGRRLIDKVSQINGLSGMIVTPRPAAFRGGSRPAR